LKKKINTHTKTHAGYPFDGLPFGFRDPYLSTPNFPFSNTDPNVTRL